MSEPQQTPEHGADKDVGLVHVQVSSGAVHKAVRNILSNEMRLDPELVRNEVLSQAERVIAREVLDYLKGNGYGKAALDARVHAYVEKNLDDLKRVTRDVLESVVRQVVREEVEGVVGAVIKDGLEVRLGYNRLVKVKLAREGGTAP